MRRAIALAILSIAPAMAVACGGGMSDQQAGLLRMAQKADLRAYAWAGPSSSAGAEARLAYCTTDRALALQDAGTYDSDGAITCAAPSKP